MTPEETRHFCPLRSRREKRRKEKLNDWLSSANVNCFLTLTFKQGMLEPMGFTPISSEIVADTINHMMNKLVRTAHGNLNRTRTKNRKPQRGRKPKIEIPRVAFIEWSAKDKLHAHIALQLPLKMTAIEFSQWMRSAIPEIRWLRRQFKIGYIYDKKGLIDYCLKDGSASFCPEATTLSMQLA